MVIVIVIVVIMVNVLFMLFGEEELGLVGGDVSIDGKRGVVVEVVFPLLWIIFLVEQLGGTKYTGVGQHPVTTRIDPTTD